MNKHFELFAIIVLLVWIWGLYAWGTYVNCLIDHRKDQFFLTDRTPIHEQCTMNLNPFRL